MVAHRQILLACLGAFLAQTCSGYASVARTHSRVAAVSRVRDVIACAPPAAGVVVPPIVSECGYDHRPLANALAKGDLLEADAITRATLIGLGGEQAVMRGFVYFTEVKKLPYKDMATIDGLWRAYTDNKQGFSVQSKYFNSPRIANNLIALYKRIGWSNKEAKLLRWTSGDGNEFIYDNDVAPAGHLPLTSTLRGTRLLLELMKHPAIVEASKTVK